MPLTDALFLEPFPFHIWVAGRGDRQAGTGTHSDPLSANTPDQFDKVMNGVQSPPEFSVRDVIIRKNLIRNVDDAPSEYTRAIEVAFCERARLENNIISLFNTDPYFNPILHRPLQSVRTFNNMKPDGSLVRSQLYDPPFPFAVDVVTTIEQDIDDATLAALLKL